MNQERLLVLLGPTAVGKTELSIQLAKRLNAEIISGDSMQVYRGMDIGTAKISKEEMQGVPHHMMDIVDPRDSFSVSKFQQLTKTAIRDISARHRLPILVGGTGLYIESLCYEYSFAGTNSDSQFRDEMESVANLHGNQLLHQKLSVIDPEAAANIHPNDRRRVIRALEIHHLSGQTMSERNRLDQRVPLYQHCFIGCTRPREELYERVNRRVDHMIGAGLVIEVEHLLERGCRAQDVAMQGLGYKEIIQYLHGNISLEESIQLIKKRSRNYAKRQWSWFRHMSDIHWLDLSVHTNLDEQIDLINGIITKKFTSS